MSILTIDRIGKPALSYGCDPVAFYGYPSAVLDPIVKGAREHFGTMYEELLVRFADMGSRSSAITIRSLW